MDQDVSLSATLPLSCCYFPTHRAMMLVESHSQKKPTHAAVLQTNKFISLKLFICKLVWTDNATKFLSVFVVPSCTLDNVGYISNTNDTAITQTNKIPIGRGEIDGNTSMLPRNSAAISWFGNWLYSLTEDNIYALGDAEG